MHLLDWMFAVCAPMIQDGADMTEPFSLVQGALDSSNFNPRFVVEGAFQKMFQKRNDGITPAPIFAQSAQNEMWALRNKQTGKFAGSTS